MKIAIGTTLLIAAGFGLAGAATATADPAADGRLVNLTSVAALHDDRFEAFDDDWDDDWDDDDCDDDDWDDD